MNRVIDGERYDTDEAEELARVEHEPRTSFEHHEETLYRKGSGRYFIHGCGNAKSRYAVHTAQGYVPGERIVPISYARAMEWASDELDADGYESIFGEVPDAMPGSEASADMCVRVKASTYERIEEMADDAGITRGQLIDGLVTEACEEREIVPSGERIDAGMSDHGMVTVKLRSPKGEVPADITVSTGGFWVNFDALYPGDSPRVARTLMAAGVVMGNRRNLLRLLLTVEYDAIDTASSKRKALLAFTAGISDQEVEGMLEGFGFKEDR